MSLAVATLPPLAISLQLVSHLAFKPLALVTVLQTHWLPDARTFLRLTAKI
jgi:hypothetical protein